MFKRILLPALLSLMVLPASGQLAGGGITFDNLVARESDGTVAISFGIEIGADAVAKKETYVFAPVLSDGNYRVSLPPVVVEGTKTKAGRERRTWASGEPFDYPDAIRTSNGQVVNYYATVEAQSWMHGGRLYVEAVSGACCGVYEDRNLVIAESLHLYDEPAPREVVTEIKRFRPKSVADSLSMIFPFIIPETMFDADDPFKIYDEEHDNSMIVYFHQGRHNIDPAYRDNRQTLTNLTAAVEMILGEHATKVERVVVAGFASPEGSFEFNERLAYNRALAVKGHLISTTVLRDEQIWLHNGSVDWQGLRLLVAKSDMAARSDIISIIDKVPEMDEAGKLLRLDRLKSLGGGEPYRYMLKELFPLLRNGAFIKVYYSNNEMQLNR